MCVTPGSAWYFFPMLPVRVLGMVVLSGVLGFPGYPWCEWVGPSGSYLCMGCPFANFLVDFQLEGTRAPPGDDF